VPPQSADHRRGIWFDEPEAARRRPAGKSRVRESSKKLLGDVSHAPTGSDKWRPVMRDCRVRPT